LWTAQQKEGIIMENEKINPTNELGNCVRCGKEAQYRQHLTNPQIFMPYCVECYMKWFEELKAQEPQVEKSQDESFVLEESTEKPNNLFSQGWSLEIQETQQFKDKNIVVLINAKGKRLFMKCVKMLDGFIELAPISRQEAIENKINFEESMNQTYFEGEFEESLGTETTKDGKIIHKFNSESAEDMRKAASTALEIANRLEKSNVQESTESQNSEIETLRAERDNYKEMVALIAQKEFEKKRAEIQAPLTITTIEELKAYSEGKKSAIVKPINAGCVPLSSQQSSSNPQAFGSHEEMIDNIRDRCSAQNPNKQDRATAQAILDKLMEKAFKGQTDCNKPFSYEQPTDLSLNDILNAKYQRRKRLGKGES
jgi:hypothetical protein